MIYIIYDNIYHFMSNIKVVDINNEEAKQEETPPIEETPTIEEAKEEVQEEKAIEETVEEVTEVQPKAKAKPKAKPKLLDKVNCETCDKSMSYKNYRYRHEKLCTDEPQPVRPHAKPKAKVKMMPKPKFKEVEVNEQPQEQQQPVQKPIREASPQQPINPLTHMAHHYQLLQHQFIQQKREKYNNLCQSMFSTKSKKR